MKDLVSEAELHAEEDSERRALVDLRNTGEGLVYSVEQALQEYGSHLEEGERGEVEESLEKARGALETSEADALREAVEDLQQLAYRMTEAMYERMQAAEEPSS